MGRHSEYAPGDRVVVTKWPDEFPGTVTNADEDSVFVAYDGLMVEDQLTRSDLRRRDDDEQD